MNRQVEFPKDEYTKAAAYLKHLETQPFPPDYLALREIAGKWVVVSQEKTSDELIAGYWKKYGVRK